MGQLIGCLACVDPSDGLVVDVPKSSAVNVKRLINFGCTRERCGVAEYEVLGLQGTDAVN